jgi:hypothetical protein
MCLWEMLVGEKPWAGLSNHQVVFNVLSGKRPDLRGRLSKAREMIVLDSADDMLVALCERCWVDDSKQRPLMSEVLEVLNLCYDSVLEGESGSGSGSGKQVQDMQHKEETFDELDSCYDALDTRTESLGSEPEETTSLNMKKSGANDK